MALKFLRQQGAAFTTHKESKVSTEVTDVCVKSKIVTFASQRIIEFSSGYNKTQLSRFCCHQ